MFVAAGDCEFEVLALARAAEHVNFVIVDDLTTEKKDRTVNEPIVFYQPGSHQADEFVVNSVSKDKISGYISVPKNQVQTSAAASSK